MVVVDQLIATLFVFGFVDFNNDWGGLFLAPQSVMFTYLCISSFRDHVVWIVVIYVW